ncbi:MAG: ABC transporter substrate-binding protein [Proteobacteria bacterium]|nr:ABC transporter substrate-binding protein [Pseudomonadota bacterium]
MRRRDCLALLLGTAGAWPYRLWAQTAGRVYRIAVLGILRRASETVFRDAMRDLGYVEGRNVLYQVHYAGQADRLAETAALLVQSQPDVIVTAGGPAAEAAKAATASIPIVLWGAGDPVGIGVVVNISHPEANITGVTELSTELTAKRLQLLQETVAGLSRVAVIWNEQDRAMSLRFREAEAAAQILGIGLMTLPIRDLKDFDAAFAMLAQSPPDGVLVVTDLVTAQRHSELIEFLRAHRLASIFEFPEQARAGGLLSYGASIAELAPRAASFVDKILKGAKPSDLPLEAPARLRLIANLKTARAIGRDIPTSILIRADEVIE